MVSRRNFFTITLITLVVLFIFQIPGLAKDAMNEYDQNSYENTTETGLDETSEYTATAKDAKETGRFVVYIGDCADDSTGNTVSQWCTYTKRYLEEYSSISDYEPDDALLPEAVLIDTNYLDVEEDLDVLTELTESGINLIFCNLPEKSVIAENSDLMDLLGIRSTSGNDITAKGVRSLEGFLLGGQKDYRLGENDEESMQDFELDMPWYVTASGTKTYMMAIYEFAEEGDISSESLPAIIWRNSIGNAQVYVVNGDYLEDTTGIGILSAFITEMNDYDLYPVVNAQSFVVTNYPNLSDENEEEMMELYSRSMEAVYQDIVWPSLVSIAQRNSLTMTCLMTPQMDYSDDADPDEELLVYYMKLLQEQNAETGISLSHNDSIDTSQKVMQDEEFLSSVIPEYSFLSVYQGDLTSAQLEESLSQELLSDVRTVYTDYDAHEMLFSYLDTGITTQSSVSDGFSHTFREDFLLASVETTLGYSSILVDMNRIGYPENEEDTWTSLSKKLSSYTSTYWKAYDTFESTTLAESDARVRRFLALDYTQEREDDQIYLTVENFDEEAWFVLRTHGETIAKIEGASYEEIEENAYLLDISESEVVITLEGSESQYY